MTSHVNVSWPCTLPLQGFTPPMLVFVQSIERAKELFHELIYDGLNVDVIHSERTQAQRDNVVKCFRTGKVCVPAPPLQPQIAAPQLTAESHSHSSIPDLDSDLH